MTPEELDALVKENERLKQENASLKSTIFSLRKQVAEHQKYTMHRRRLDDDYVPYEDDDRYR